jgi:hypothetical protein
MLLIEKSILAKSNAIGTRADILDTHLRGWRKLQCSKTSNAHLEKRLFVCCSEVLGHRLGHFLEVEVFERVVVGGCRIDIGWNDLEEMWFWSRFCVEVGLSVRGRILGWARGEALTTGGEGEFMYSRDAFVPCRRSRGTSRTETASL